MSEPLKVLRAAYDDRTAEARRRKAAGETVIGYFLNSVPEELILAAGCFPVRLAGHPSRRSAVAERYMEEYFDGEVRSIFGSLVEGEFSFADLVVIPRNSDVYLHLYYMLREIPKWEPDARTPPLHLFDLLQTPGWTTAQYVVGRLRAMAQRFEALVGREISDDALRAAIRTTNASRKLLIEARALWGGAAPALDGVDALKVIGSASAMARADHDAALRALLANPPTARSRRPRILIKGSPQSDVRFTALVERSGGAVVAHDHLWGDRTYAALIDETQDPWEALAVHYSCAIPSPREFPQARADAHFLALALQARVDGVIFYHDEWDDTLGWEYPDQKALLDERGIPSLFLKRQPWFDPDEEAQAAAVTAFIESLGKGASA
jgi:benzoyl-CoA reductase/2-hydroxyglutaryl-CoA dehydratase subunit BcrC/BadD/HgdB